MAIERTFSIIKPDATARNVTGAINAMIEKAGLRIVATFCRVAARPTPGRQDARSQEDDEVTDAR